jgi:hypothetical protein
LWTVLSAEFEMEAQRVYREVVDGRDDIPWLRAQIDRLTAATERLDSAGMARAELLLGRLREQLALSEADQAWAATGAGEHPVAQAIRVRANAGHGEDPAERISGLRAARAEVDALAAATEDERIARVVRGESWLIAQQITAMETVLTTAEAGFDGR